MNVCNELHIWICLTHEQWMRVTGWRRLIGSPKLQIIFHKRATKYRALLRKMTYEDKASYGSSPPSNESVLCMCEINVPYVCVCACMCMHVYVRVCVCMCMYVYVCVCVRMCMYVYHMTVSYMWRVVSHKNVWHTWIWMCRNSCHMSHVTHENNRVRHVCETRLFLSYESCHT